MLLNRTYYFFKPFIPRQVRLGLRRWHANCKRRLLADRWPIDAGAGATPPGWPGWPEGKRFALVLTHDVEGSHGISRVEQLMKLELKYGFRSCFNFVPEGEYSVQDAMRELLDHTGFEVGVHGLEHDGKLYNSRSRFVAKAARIRKYIELWNASGFRSPLMQHKLAWLHAIPAEYDSSTFDTDPFEPEPDGTGTIFPFWVPGPNNAGYVELPYTLPQDFTLFIVLRERRIDIWKQKLDWIAEKGGMALIITHPDYMCFGGQQAPHEFPVSYYEEFLCYVREKYEGSYWAAQPREVNRYYRDRVLPFTRNTRKKICMLAYTHYESDNRVRRYAESLVKRGDKVDVVSLRSEPSQPWRDEINGVSVFRIQGRERNERYISTYAWRLLRFLLRSSVSLTRLHARNRYDLIHVHNMPDFLVFAAWYPKFTGVKLILDIHDIVPELFASKFETALTMVSIRLLKAIEKMSARFADHVIVSNDLWQERLVARSVPRNKCSVVINHVDPAVFYRRPRTRTDDKFVILFPGSLQWHQGLDIAIEAFAYLKRAIPNAEFHIYSGEKGNMEANLVQLGQRLGLNGSIKFNASVPVEQIAQVIANADLGVVPKRDDLFGNEAYSTKVMEFMSQGVPVVVSRTKIDAFYFGEGVVRFFPPGDSHAMSEAMLDVINNKNLRESLVARGREYADRNNWNRKRKQYLDLVDYLSTEYFDDFSNTCSTRDPESRAAGTSVYGKVGLQVEPIDRAGQTSVRAQL
jgi:glycosyltransferase involved in cell wall biosynthesis